MKTLPDLLRETDPLRYEPRRSAQERQISRQRVLDGLDDVQERPRRRIAIVAFIAVAVVFVGIATGSRYWARIAVDVVAAVRFEVRLAEDSPGDGLREVAISSTGRKVYLHQETVVTNSDIAQASVIQGEGPSMFNVSVVFNAAGAQKISRATEGHVGGPLAILVDGDVVIAPVVRAPITTSAIISGNYTKAEAERIVAGILGR